MRHTAGLRRKKNCAPRRSDAKTKKRPEKAGPASARNLSHPFTREQLSFLEKFALLGELLGTVAHELNTPISTAVTGTENISLGFASLLEAALASFARGSNRKDADETLRTLSKALERVNSLDPVPLEEARRRAQGLAQKLGWSDMPSGVELARWLVRLHIEEEANTVKDLASRMGIEVVSSLLRAWGRITTNNRSVHLAAKHLAELVNSLQIYTHPGSMGPEPADVNEQIEHTLVLLSGKIKRLPEIRKCLKAVPPVLCHNNELIQVWTNLIMNAVDATEGKGKVEVRTEFMKNSVKILVIDSGAGIPEEYTERIFEPLFTTKEEGKGTGLGLWITRQILERHSGSIRVQSRPGRTSFEVTLPSA